MNDSSKFTEALDDERLTFMSYVPSSMISAARSSVDEVIASIS
jgi:hypothetical protein